MTCPRWLIPARNLVSSYPLLAALVLLMLLVIWGQVLDEYGAFHLFWHEDWWAALLSGVAVSFLFGEILLVVRVIDGYRDLPSAANTAAATNPPTTIPPRKYYFFTWAALLVLSWVPIATAMKSPISPDPTADAAKIDAAPPPATGPECPSQPARDVKEWTFDPGRLWFVAGGALFWVIACLRFYKEDRNIKDLGERTQRLAERAYRQRLRVAILYGTILGLNLAFSDWFARNAGFLVPALSVCILFAVYAELYGYVQTRFTAYWFYAAVLWFPILLVWSKDKLGTLRDDIGFHPAWTEWAGPVGLALGLMVALAGWLMKWNARRTILVAGIVAALGFLLQAPFEYRIRGLETAYGKSEDERPHLANYGELRKAHVKGLLNDRAVRDAWLREQPATAGRYPKLVMVCVSGGASKSALFTAAVLCALDRNIEGFGRQVRIISGASGGMVGASVFVAYLQKVRQWEAEGKQGEDLRARKKELADKLLDALGEDLLSPLMHRWVFHDVAQYFIWPYAYDDRSQALESRLNDRFKSILGEGHGLDEPMKNLRDLEGAGKLPSLIFSPMTVEDGRRVLISNLDLAYMTETDLDAVPFPRGNQRKPLSVSAMELFKLFPESVDNFRLGTAARLNAAFPYVSPACVLPTQPRRRLVDAGYYDNYGISVAGAWLAEHAVWVQRAPISGIVLLQVRAFGNECERKRWTSDEELLKPGAVHQPTLQGYTAPLEGAFAARRASMFFRNDEQLRDMSLLLNDDAETPFSFDTVAIECPADAGLNWYLTKNDRDKIRDLPKYLGVVSESVKVLPAGSPEGTTAAVVQHALRQTKVTPGTKQALSPAAEAIYKLQQRSVPLGRGRVPLPREKKQDPD